MLIMNEICYSIENIKQVITIPEITNINIRIGCDLKVRADRLLNDIRFQLYYIKGI